MEILYHSYTPAEYSNHEYLVDKEIDFLMEISGLISERELEAGDEKNISIELIPERCGYSLIYWLGIRKGVMYSGFDSDKTDPNSRPTQWLMYFIPDSEVKIAALDRVE